MIRYALPVALRTDSAPELDPNTVTPGVIGFFAIFFVAGAVVLLMLDMTRRIRRTRYRGEVAERLDAEEAARAESEREETDRIIRPLDFDETLTSDDAPRFDDRSSDDRRPPGELPDRDRPAG